MKINIGAGDTNHEGFLNCDYSDLFNPDYIFDLEKDTFPFEDNSVDEVIASHVLEHLGEGYFHCLKELYRICKNDAIIHVKVPHYRHHNQAHDPTHRRFITNHGLRLFNQEFNRTDTGNASKLGLQFGIDFRIIHEHNTLDENHPAYSKMKDKDPQFVSEFAYGQNNVYEESHFTLKVVK